MYFSHDFLLYKRFHIARPLDAIRLMKNKEISFLCVNVVCLFLANTNESIQYLLSISRIVSIVFIRDTILMNIHQ